MADELVGKILGKYKIESLIGRGGMATVYLATHQQLGTKVALKVLPAGFATQPEMAERFLREAKTAAQLNHPNIVRVYDVDQIDGVSFFVMDFVEGKSLKQIMKKKGNIPEDQIVNISKSVLSALKEAHSRGIVHRDIKPDNIMIDSTGKPLVTDFGIAKTTMDSDLTRTGMFLGTMKYASPEQIKGEAVDSCSEMYSWGVVMYEMATGVSAFKSEEPTAILYNIIHETPEEPHVVNPSLSHSLSELISKSISKERSERFPSADEFSAALEGLPLGDDDATKFFSVDDDLAFAKEAEDPDRTRLFTGDELLENLAAEKAGEIFIDTTDGDNRRIQSGTEKKSGLPLSFLVAAGAVVLVFLGGLSIYNYLDFFSDTPSQKVLLNQQSQTTLPEDTLAEDAAVDVAAATPEGDVKDGTETSAVQISNDKQPVYSPDTNVTSTTKIPEDEVKNEPLGTEQEAVETTEIAYQKDAVGGAMENTESIASSQKSEKEEVEKLFPLTVSVIPDYAQVFLNGSAVPINASGNYSLSAPKGNVKILVKADSYVPYSEQFTLQDNHEIKVDLMPIEYSLNISVAPADSIVAVDSSTVDNLSTGKAQVRVSPGEHTITVGASGYKTENLRVLMDKNRSVVVNLEKMNTIEVEKIAVGAQVNKNELDVWTDKQEYRVGENLKIFFRSEKDCYVYLYHESADGDIQLIFPNQFNENNYITGGKTYTIPDPSYDFQFTVQPPLGIERIKALVTSKKKVAAEWQQLGVDGLMVNVKEIEDSTILRIVE